MSATEELFDNNVRIEEIFWIPGAVADAEGLPERFSEFLEDIYDLDKNRERLEESLSNQVTFDGEEWEVAESFYDVPGFIFRGSTPIMKYDKESGNRDFYGWGVYTTEWLYASSESEIFPVLMKWVEGIRKSEEIETC